jgi:hypothetical protein
MCRETLPLAVQRKLRSGKKCGLSHWLNEVPREYARLPSSSGTIVESPATSGESLLDLQFAEEASTVESP